MQSACDCDKDHLWLSIPTLGRAGIAIATGIVFGLPFALSNNWLYAALIFWDVTVLVFMIGLWLSVRDMDPGETERHAVAEDPGRAAIDAIMVTASLASLAAVGVLIVQAGSVGGVEEAVNIGLGVVSVVISWLSIHFIFMLRYAHLYFKQEGSIDFNSKEPPTYQDFAYLAFTIGMTYQVSDTSLTTSEQRRTARQHALLSYIFGTAIIATTINAVAGLGR